MLTRLKVSGFKNLNETEIRLGPLTCIAGFNGVGKSNIFDAIHFLSLLADHPFVEAASMTRGGDDLLELFTIGGDRRMIFECDMIIPRTGVDEFRQPAEASQTFLTYALTLRLEEEGGLPRIRLEHESLEYIAKKGMAERVGFSHTPAWIESVVVTSHRRAPFIGTEQDKNGEKLIRLSADRMRDDTKPTRGGGRHAEFLARNLPRTVLSAAQNADEARTAVLARAEMRTWRILQLEPSALRQPDELQAPRQMDVNGRYLASNLYRLAHAHEGGEERLYTEVSNRLSALVADVRTIGVDRDDARRLLRLVMTDRAGVVLPASSLSDGTLRFIALSVLTHDPMATGVLLLEEPENGIHPERMDAMLRLLRDMAVDPAEPVGEDNPLRQVVLSTHSPIVASRIRPDELLFADHRDLPGTPTRRGVVLRPIAGEWRSKSNVLPSPSPVAHGKILEYLGSIQPQGEEEQATLFDLIAPHLGLPVASR